MLLLLILTLLMHHKMSVIVLVTAILVLVNIKVSSADGAWVEPSATEELEKPFTNVVVSKQVLHLTSPAQLISELQIARDTLATGLPRNAL